MTKKYLFVLTIFLTCSCSNLENVKPSSLNSFQYFYGGEGNFTAVGAQSIDGGYLIVADSIATNDYGILLIKTDLYGKTIWRKLIPHGTANSFIIQDSGYLIIGDSIKVDLTQAQVVDQIKRKMRLISVSTNSEIIIDKSWADTTAGRVDYSGSALTIDAEGNYISTSSIKFPKSTTSFGYAQVIAHDPKTLDIIWSKKYNQDNRDYLNSKSVYINQSNNVIWATSAISSNTTSALSFLRVPVLEENSAFVNSGLFGQNEGNYYSGSDIQGSAIGFGIIGTYQSFTGANSNVFFIRTDLLGNIISGSDLYFDGPTTLKDNKSLDDKTVSQTQDQGICLTATSNSGYLLAGYTTTTTDGTWGSGGKDVYLIRIDPFGNILWTKTIGGSGDEVPSTVKQTSDGGFLICGTLTLAGQSSVFIMKTDSNGNLKN